MRIAVVQLAYGDDEPFGDRVDRVAALVAEQSGHDLVVLPELWGATGFGYRRWPGEAQPLDGPWVAAMISPPPARCWRISSVSRSRPAASSADVGSSRSQIGREMAISRASESRRLCPAER